MRSKETDEQVAERTMAYMLENPGKTRTAIAKKVQISPERLDKLQQMGLIKGYPKPLTSGDAARVASRNSFWKKTPAP
jgi:hypothetical protein